MKIFLRIGLFLFLSFVQLCLFWIVYVMTWIVMGNDERTDLFWGITLRLSIFVFAILSTISALPQTYKWKYRWFITLGLFLFFCWFFGNTFNVTHYRTALLLVSGAIGLAIPPAFLELVRRFRRKPDESETLLDADEDLKL